MTFTHSDEAMLPASSWIDSGDLKRDALLTETPEPKEPAETQAISLSYTDSLVRLYAERAVRHARYEELEDGTWFATVVGLEGAWGEGETPEEAETDLYEVLRGWVVVKVERGDVIPEIDGITF